MRAKTVQKSASGGVGDPALVAGEPPAAGTVGLGPQAQCRRVGARVGFGEGEGGNRRAVGDGGQPALALGGGAVGVDGVGAEALEGEGGLGLGAAMGEGLPHQAQVERAGREEAGEQAEAAQFGDEGPVDPAGVALLGERAQPVGGQGAQLGAPGGLCRFE
ncbi:hypothetical protein GCM10020256_15150 [Streptomyces thermocoprophilus]